MGLNSDKTDMSRIIWAMECQLKAMNNIGATTHGLYKYGKALVGALSYLEFYSIHYISKPDSMWGTWDRYDVWIPFDQDGQPRYLNRSKHSDDSPYWNISTWGTADST